MLNVDEFRHAIPSAMVTLLKDPCIITIWISAAKGRTQGGLIDFDLIEDGLTTRSPNETVCFLDILWSTRARLSNGHREQNTVVLD